MVYWALIVQHFFFRFLITCWFFYLVRLMDLLISVLICRVGSICMGFLFYSFGNVKADMSYFRWYIGLLFLRSFFTFPNFSSLLSTSLTNNLQTDDV